jgi:FRG domain-containing protein
MGAWSRFLEEIDDAEKQLSPSGPMWYRGHGNVTYELVPSLMRYPNGTEVEPILLKEYIDNGGPRFTARVFNAYIGDDVLPAPDPDWMTVFHMQHWGIPTRLLDWSETLPVAIAFAVLDRDDGDASDAAIFILDPEALNATSLRKRAIKSMTDDGFKYVSVFLNNDPVPPVYPIAIAPPRNYRNERMSAQRGTFTVHGTNSAPLDQQVAQVTRKVVLPSTLFDDARNFLRQTGVELTTIYPDVVGIAKYVRRKYLKPISAAGAAGVHHAS